VIDKKVFIGNGLPLPQHHRSTLTHPLKREAHEPDTLRHFSAPLEHQHPGVVIQISQ
jgi:hypothetical protein